VRFAHSTHVLPSIPTLAIIMVAQLPQLSANPLRLVRELPTSLVPLDQLKAQDGVSEDEIFLSKYVAFLRGKAPIHETRASLSTIRRGLWKRDGASWVLVDDLSVKADVDNVVDLIRLGSRPVLYLYENPNRSDDKRFVCSDDRVVHAAYERLPVVWAQTRRMVDVHEFRGSVAVLADGGRNLSALRPSLASRRGERMMPLRACKSMRSESMRRIVISALVFACANSFAAPANDLTLLGNFHNVTSLDGGEHCNGYSLGLWEYRGRLLGLFDHHIGLCGDPPCSVIANAKLRKDGRLSFTSNIWSEKFDFSGVVRAKVVLGKVNGQRVRLDREDFTGQFEPDTSLRTWCSFWQSVPRCTGVKELCAELQ
jgi:hypothetical protein